ncbi:MAG: hypothetical protein CM1200mP36_09090 [Gammaproteobacteria bacterium]|nr:MAG: hypothetical protein CM1200mP36_09090 [Gammaproteobacteria bacterium]
MPITPIIHRAWGHFFLTMRISNQKIYTQAILWTVAVSQPGHMDRHLAPWGGGPIIFNSDKIKPGSCQRVSNSAVPSRNSKQEP